MTKKKIKSAFITGMPGMDASHLADYLLNLGYLVYGFIRRSSNRNYENILHILLNDNFELILGDLADQNSIYRALVRSNPDLVYNLGAQSFVALSFKTPENTANITGLGCLRVLESIRLFDGDRKIKFYQAGSSEMFGKMVLNPANEYTPFYPRSPYGVSKVFAHYMTKNYRLTYDMYACNGILFNHLSERRGHEFVTRKITAGIKDILDGKKQYIELGNLDARRDWGYAPLYVKAMHLMLQQQLPGDYIVATGLSHSIKEFLEIAFNYAGLDNWLKYVRINPIYYRPCEVDVLCGNASKIKSIGWLYNITFKKLVENMMKKELEK